VCRPLVINIGVYTVSQKKTGPFLFEQNFIIIIITDLYSAFSSEDTEVLDAAQED